MALLDVQVAVLANQSLNYLTSGEVPRRLGNTHPNIVPYQVFPSADGHLIVTVGNDSQFRRFCQVLGCEEFADDPRFATNSARVEYREVLVPELRQRLAMRSTDSWLVELERVGVPCGPINTLDKVFDDAQVRHRGMRLSMPHSKAGQVDLVGNPIRIDGQRLEANTVPPALGAHSDEVLSQLLGLDEETLLGLRQRGVIGGSRV